MITYATDDKTTRVLLDGKLVGYIKPVTGGYQYITRFSKAKGEVLCTIEAVKASLESEE